MINPDKIARLLKEQDSLRSKLNMLIKFGYLGMDNNTVKTLRRYKKMQVLAPRIIAIENILEIWANSVMLNQIIATEEGEVY